MSTDRELLELAAKAVKLPNWYPKNRVIYYSFAPEFGYSVWNPLEDDADALLLAVDLGLIIDIDRDRCCVTVSDHSGRSVVQKWDGQWPDDATRRAIVLLAAEIGRAMP